MAEVVYGKFRGKPEVGFEENVADFMALYAALLTLEPESAEALRRVAGDLLLDAATDNGCVISVDGPMLDRILGSMLHPRRIRMKPDR